MTALSRFKCLVNGTRTKMTFDTTYLQNGIIRGMAGKFVDTISIFNRKRNSVKMNISGFEKIFHEQIDEIL